MGDRTITSHSRTWIRSGAPLALLLLVSASGCDRPDNPSLSTHGNQEAGDSLTIIARGDWLDEPVRGARETLAIGTDADGAAYQFFRIGDVIPSRDGDIFVLDAGNREIAVFDETGILLRRIGRRGAGPGEFAAPRAMALARDTVFVNVRPFREESN